MRIEHALGHLPFRFPFRQFGVRRERYVWPASEAELERWVRHICRDRVSHGYELVDDGTP